MLSSVAVAPASGERRRGSPSRQAAPERTIARSWPDPTRFLPAPIPAPMHGSRSTGIRASWVPSGGHTARGRGHDSATASKASGGAIIRSTATGRRGGHRSGSRPPRRGLRPHDIPAGSRVGMAPAVRFELTTKRLTAARSTTELRRNGTAGSALAVVGRAHATGRKDTADAPRRVAAGLRGQGRSIGLSGRLPHSSHEPA